jgi:hypothetical protein
MNRTNGVRPSSGHRICAGTERSDAPFPGVMRIFHVPAEVTAPHAPPAPPRSSSPRTPTRAMMLLRKDINFTGYRLPPAENEPEGVILSAGTTATVQINPRPPSATQ